MTENSLPDFARLPGVGFEGGLRVCGRSCVVAVIQNAGNGAWLRFLNSSIGRKHLKSHADRERISISLFDVNLARETGATSPCEGCFCPQTRNNPSDDREIRASIRVSDAGSALLRCHLGAP